MSYDQLKGSGIPTYGAMQQGTNQPALEAASIQERNLLYTNNSTHGKNQCWVDEEYVPASIPVEHLNLEFKEFFPEHQSTRTIQSYYSMMEYIYKYVKFGTYHLFVLVFGIFLVIIFGIINGIVSFGYVWLYGPLLKYALIVIYSAAPLATVPLVALLTPLVDVHARFFRQIRIRFNLTGLPKERCNV